MYLYRGPLLRPRHGLRAGRRGHGRESDQGLRAPHGGPGGGPGVDDGRRWRQGAGRRGVGAGGRRSGFDDSDAARRSLALLLLDRAVLGSGGTTCLILTLL